jgi:hypothetical protein
MSITRVLGWVLVGLEALWAICWLVFMLILQCTTDDTNHGFDYRFSIIIVALHAVSPIALLGVMNEHHGHSAMTAWFFTFAIMTDTWSLLDAALHLSRTENYPAWRMVMGSVSWAFALGILTLVWYLVFVICLKGNPSTKTVATQKNREPLLVVKNVMSI